MWTWTEKASSTYLKLFAIFDASYGTRSKNEVFACPVSSKTCTQRPLCHLWNHRIFPLVFVFLYSFPSFWQSVQFCIFTFEQKLRTWQFRVWHLWTCLTSHKEIPDTYWRSHTYHFVSPLLPSIRRGEIVVSGSWVFLAKVDLIVQWSRVGGRGGRCPRPSYQDLWGNQEKRRGQAPKIAQWAHSAASSGDKTKGL